MDFFSPIKYIANTTTYNLLNLTPESYLAEATYFFINDIIKIGIMLVLINFIMAVFRFYFPLEKVRDILAKKRLIFLKYLFAALLGVVTPFCTCSSIPLFIGFIGAGIPLGVTFTFLISSPLINESSLYLFPSIFGWKITILYNLFGIIIAIFGGMLIEKLNVKKYILPELISFRSKTLEENKSNKTPFVRLIPYFWKDGLSITRQVFPYLIFGVALGALIHGFVPTSLIENYLSSKSLVAIPIAVLLGVPLYANSVSVLPIMEAMAGKGAPIGTILSFMTGIVSLSLPEALILKKIMKWQLLAIFFGITSVGIIIMGYVFNFLF